MHSTHKLSRKLLMTLTPKAGNSRLITQCMFGVYPSQWLRGHVCEVRRHLSYKAQLENGQVIQCHVDHIRQRTDMNSPSGSSSKFDDFPLVSKDRLLRDHALPWCSSRTSRPKSSFRPQQSYHIGGEDVVKCRAWMEWPHDNAIPVLCDIAIHLL